MTWRAYFGYGPSEAVTEADVRKKYKKLAVRLHPNKGGKTENFQALGQMLDSALANIRPKPPATTKPAMPKRPPPRQSAAPPRARCPAAAHAQLQSLRCITKYLDSQCRPRCPSTPAPPTKKPATTRPAVPKRPPPRQPTPPRARCPAAAHARLQTIRCATRYLNARCRPRCDQEGGMGGIRTGFAPPGYTRRPSGSRYAPRRPRAASGRRGRRAPWWLFWRRA
jgi:hypothetical protein